MQLFESNEAELLLGNETFLSGWKKLMKECPWSTIFQSPEFVCTWYGLFSGYPKIILCEMVDGEPKGLLFLTEDQNGVFVGAGTNLAEYQGWISDPQDTHFLPNAIKTLKERYPNKLVHLKYIPDIPYLIKQQGLGAFPKSMLIINHSRPIMENHIDWLEKELKKKNRKEKINRLKRLGTLELEKIETLMKFKEVLPTLIYQNDLRKGAMYGKTAFIDEPVRRDFLIALFKSDMIHVSLLKLDNEIIASNVGIKGDNKVYLQGLNTISAKHMKYSPGILHFLMMGQQLSMENIPEFDLTPGGTDGYKSMLASKFLPCHEVFFGNSWAIGKIRLRQKVKEWLQKNGAPVTLINRLQELGQYKNLTGLFSTRLEYVLRPMASAMGKDQNRDYLEFNIEPGREWDGYKVESESLVGIFNVGKKLSQRTRKILYQDSIRRMEIGQKIFSIWHEGDCVALVWFWQQPDVEQKECEDGPEISFGCEYSCYRKRMDHDKRIELAQLAFSKNISKKAKVFILA